MARPTQIEITESKEELQSRLKRARNGSSQERLLCLYWLKTGVAKSREQLVEKSGRSPATITRWLSKYRQGGITELLHQGQAPGRQSLVTAEARVKLDAKLKQPEGFNSYQEIQSWLGAECGIEVNYPVVYQLVRYKCRAKLKVPRPRSVNQYPQAIEHFKKNCLLP